MSRENVKDHSTESDMGLYAESTADNGMCQVVDDAAEDVQTMAVPIMYVIMQVPKDTLCVGVWAETKGPDGKPVTVMKILGPREIRTARKDFLTHVRPKKGLDPDFIFTDEGRAFLREQRKKQQEKRKKKIGENEGACSGKNLT